MKHTPGPWHFRGTLGPRNAEHLLGPCVIEDSRGAQLAILSGWRTDQQRYDAKLMASAPALLKALQELVAGDIGDMPQEFAAGRSAIEMATGGAE